jgi:hypothetical protein
MTTATANYPTTLRNGRTEYAVEHAPKIDTDRAPSFYIKGARGALYAMMPSVNFDLARPVWVTIPSRSHVPFDFVTITDGEWDVIR